MGGYLAPSLGGTEKFENKFCHTKFPNDLFCKKIDLTPENF